MALSEFTARGDWRLMFIGRDRIRTATVDDVRRVATSTETGQSDGRRSAPIAEPVRAEIPAAPDIAALVKDYKGDATATAGEAFDPSPSNIDARTSRGGRRGSSSALPKKTRGATVVAQFQLNYGDENSLKNRVVAGELVPAMLSRGSAKRTRQQIVDEMNRIKANVGVGGTATGTTVSIQTVRGSLPDALRLAAELLREPGFPEAEFEQLRQERIAGAELARASRPPSRR